MVIQEVLWLWWKAGMVDSLLVWDDLSDLGMNYGIQSLG
jgi:hypothetical protein